MPIVVGYVPTPEGHSALNSAIEEARLRGSRLVVINASRGDALVDRRHSSAEDWEDVQATARRLRYRARGAPAGEAQATPPINAGGWRGRRTPS